MRFVRGSALVILGAALATWSWRRWPDIQVDFGRELYAAWRLAQGDRLHAEIAWFNGPLSAWWNSLAFRVFGTSFTTLIVLNLGIVAAALAGIGALVRSAGDAAAALAAGFLFLTVFAFGQYATFGNYNFVAPYSHELVHGFVLGVAALLAVSRMEQTARARWALVAGVALGLVFLTKAEAFLAAAGATSVRLAFALAEQRRLPRDRALALFIAGLQLAPLIAFLRFATYLDPGAAARAVLEPWRHVGDAGLRDLPFYRAMTGLDRPAYHLGRTAVWTAVSLALLGTWGAAAMRLSRGRGATGSARAFAFLGGAVSTGVALVVSDPYGTARPLPGLVLALGVASVLAWRSGGTATARRSAGDACALAVFGALFLVKTALAPRIAHYGFVLSLPAALGACALLVGRIPRALERRGRGGAFFRAAAAGAVVAFGVVHLYRAQGWYERKELTVGEGGDRIVADDRGEAIGAAIAILGERLPPGGTLLVLPEGVMLNYLLRRRTPTPYVNFMPPEMILWGEEEILAALVASPPDAVAIVHKDTSEYGVPYFGRGEYGALVQGWLEERYRVTEVLGAMPLTDGRFGVAIWEPR